jgi:hypothetical protein
VGWHLPQPGRPIPAPRPQACVLPWLGPLPWLGRDPGAPVLSFPRWAGRRAGPGWAGAPFPFRRPPLLPGWASSSAPASRVLAGWLLRSAPAGPDQEDPAWPGFLPQAAISQPRLGRICMFRPGQAGISLAQARLSPSRTDYSSPGRDLPPPGHIILPASTPAPCASPGTPLGSDWHVLHRHMLVLGCPVAQTSIFHLS